jgi:hypothetical protein
MCHKHCFVNMFVAQKKAFANSLTQASRIMRARAMVWRRPFKSEWLRRWPRGVHELANANLSADMKRGNSQAK